MSRPGTSTSPSRSSRRIRIPGSTTCFPKFAWAVFPYCSPCLGPMTVLEKEWIKSLANALHVAQDRGSHREGVMGYGHSDKRSGNKPAWNPDSPGVHTHPANDPEGLTWRRCNVAAYNKALNNSYEVMQAFLSGLGVQPGSAPPEPVDCSQPSAGGPSLSAPDNRYVRNRHLDHLSIRYECVCGRLPGPLGTRQDQYAAGRMPGPLGAWFDKYVAGRLPGPLGQRHLL